jgi:hypothetical protein
MESGGDPSKGPDAQDGEFWPDYRTQYPKIEREIHSAVWSFLTQIAAIPVTGPSVPPPPTPTVSTTTPPPKSCVIATTLYRGSAHPAVEFLRDVRDRQLPATFAGDRFAVWLTAGYDQVAPPLASWFSRHPAAAWVTRAVLLDPFVGILRAVSSATSRLPRTRSLILSAGLAVVAGPVIATARSLNRPAPAPRPSR